MKKTLLMSFICFALLAACGPKPTPTAAPNPTAMPDAGPRAVAYTYDDAGRLIRTDYGGVSIAYEYDNAGNLLSREVVKTAGFSPVNMAGAITPSPPFGPLTLLVLLVALLPLAAQIRRLPSPTRHLLPPIRHLSTVARLALILSFLASAFGLNTGAARAGNLPPVPGNTLTSGDVGSTTLTTGDPINAATGEFYFSRNFLDLGGPMSLRFDLYYGSLLERSNEDSISSALSNLPDGFSTNLRPWLAEYPFTDPPMVYVNLGMGREAGFRKTGSGWQVFDEESIRYQLQKAAGPTYYLLDPAQGWVYVFGDCYAGADISICAQPLYITDRSGNRLTFDGNSVADGLGRELKIDLPNSVSDQNGRKVVFNLETRPEADPRFVAMSDLILHSITDPMGNATTIHYSGDFLASIERPAGNIPYVQTYNPAYPDHGVVATQTDAYGNVTRINADEFSIAFKEADQSSPARPWTLASREVGEDSQFTVTYPDGAQRVFRHGSGSRVMTGLADESGKEAQFQSDPAHPWITSVTDRLGGVTTFTYHPEIGNLASVTNARGETVTFTYTPQEQAFDDSVTFIFYNLTRIDYPDGASDEFAYDARGSVTGRTDRAGARWTYTYNERGQVLTATNPSGGEATYTYNDDATLASCTDTDAGVTTFAYDDYKRLSKVTRPDGTSLQFTYDLNDRITSVADENGNTRRYEYDANGNLIKFTDPAEQVYSLSYDLMDRITQIADRAGQTASLSYDVMGRPASVVDPTGVEVAFGYDPRGWLNTVTLGGQTWRTEYDAEGAPTAITTPLGYTTSYQTDALGLLTALADPLGNTTTFTRDALSRITAIVDPLGRTTNYTYDAHGLLASVSPPSLGAATHTRNELGLITALADLNGQTWSFGYTPMGRLASAADPLGNTTQYAYDERGRLIQSTLADGAELSYEYDPAGNLTGLHDPSSLDLTYTYDALNRLTEANGIAFAYDAEGRIIGTDGGPSTPTFGATYDAAGRVQTVTYEGGLTVTYTYDPATGLLASVSDNLTNTKIEFEYDADQRLTGIKRSNGVNTILTWDAASRLTGLKDGDLLDLQYTLDAAGQVTNAQITAPLDPTSNIQPLTSDFQYDAASQLAGEGYAYDALGRLVASPGHTFQWDAASRLTGADDTSLTYNALGDLISRQAGSQSPITTYHYNYALGLAPAVAEQDGGAGEFLRYYVWSPNGALLYMIDMGEGGVGEGKPRPYYYHFDRTGSTLALTDAGGAVTDVYAYDPYGQLLAHEGDSDQPFTFVGRWGVRQEGALYHMRARYYDPVTARFLSRDPIWPQIGDAKELNPYLYVGDSPINRGDPTGMPGPEFNDTWRFDNGSSEWDQVIPSEGQGNRETVNKAMQFFQRVAQSAFPEPGGGGQFVMQDTQQHPDNLGAQMTVMRFFYLVAQAAFTAQQLAYYGQSSYTVVNDGSAQFGNSSSSLNGQSFYTVVNDGGGQMWNSSTATAPNGPEQNNSGGNWSFFMRQVQLRVLEQFLGLPPEERQRLWEQMTPAEREALDEALTNWSAVAANILINAATAMH